MKKLLKNNIKLFIGILIGILISSCTIYAANSFASSEVTYTENNQTTVKSALDDLYTRANTWINPVNMTNSKSITSNGTYDITNYKNVSVSVPNTNTATYSATTRSAQIDLGATNNYRYINTSNVPNTNSGTYTPSSRSASLDMGATNTYRYVNTNSVPNTNSATYTPSSNGTALDMGATNTYRYVNTNTVYNLGYNTAKNTKVTLDGVSSIGIKTNSKNTVFANANGVCIARNFKVSCFKKNNYSAEKTHAQNVFTGATCTQVSDTYICQDSNIRCDIGSDGGVGCSDIATPSSKCIVTSSGSISCA